jgi:serine/threonine protein phosphatase PrpC
MQIVLSNKKSNAAALSTRSEASTLWTPSETSGDDPNSPRSPLSPFSPFGRSGGKARSLQQRSISEDATDAAMLKQWNAKNAWHIRADMPKHQDLNEDVEEKLHVRGSVMVQASADLLQRRQIGTINMNGKKEGSAIGQDFISISCLPGIERSWELSVVADGHGNGAHLISDRVVQTLPFFLASSECQQHLAQGQVEMALSEAFKRTEQDLQSGPAQLETELAGTTVTAILRGSDGAVYVASVGDSRAIMFRRDGSVLYSTKDHKPERPEEKARIVAAGGLCVKKKHFIGTRIFAPKCKLRYPGLTVTRSLGDACAKRLGVSAEPEVSKWETNSSDDYLLIASDGIWEFLTDSCVAEFLGDLLRSGCAPADAVEQLLQKSKQLWIEKENGYVDDIAVVLLPATLSAESQSGSSGCIGECFQQLRRACVNRWSRAKHEGKSVEIVDENEEVDESLPHRRRSVLFEVESSRRSVVLQGDYKKEQEKMGTPLKEQEGVGTPLPSDDSLLGWFGSLPDAVYTTLTYPFSPSQSNSNSSEADDFADSLRGA